ncbi:MAG: tyrosine-type recombinase/integrase [Acidobacteriota bacterium]|nr:tyrosine-type recombinase/integrase [Acidobacteriota bacterium]
MSRSEPEFEPLLTKLRQHLLEQRYGSGARFNYPHVARPFLRHLAKNGQVIETVSAADVARYLDSLKLKRYRRPFPDHSRRMHRASIHMLLRLVQGRWPPVAALASAHERATQTIVMSFDTWMTELRGLSPNTRRHLRAAMCSLLEWLHEQNKGMAKLTIDDLDIYVAKRYAGMRRNSKAGAASNLRTVLRYLHEHGHLGRDLAPLVKGPMMYALEGIPATINPEDVQRALAALKHDRSATGRRDYAIWILLTTYGLRGGEIKALELPDIDWRHERLRIRHGKTGAYSDLPLLRKPANALLDYLRHGRPATASRTVFLRAQAPYRPLAISTPLHGVVSRRLAAVGVVPTGKHGTHALRHARAVSLLRGGVSLKVIGDVLGHRSERSTAVYLKLATEDLRSVALDLPAKVAS